MVKNCGLVVVCSPPPGQKPPLRPKELLARYRERKIKTPSLDSLFPSEIRVSGLLESELSKKKSQLAILDNFCLTISLTAFPSALPAILAIAAFMTLPWSLGPVAWLSPMTWSMSISTSV